MSKFYDSTEQPKAQIIFALALIFLAVSLRLLPHSANFAPVTAIAIFGGAVLPRKFAIWVPVLAMMVSDYFIGFYSTMWVTWACFAVIALASSFWLKKPSFKRGLGLCLASSVFFFIVTNFAVWAFTGMYAHTWPGLLNCYYMALPFFRNTALSDLFYSGVLFGLFALAKTFASKHLKAATK